MTAEQTTPRLSADEIRKLVARLDEDMEDLLSTGDDSHVEDVARLCAAVESLLEDRERLDRLEAELLEEDGSEISLRFDDAGVETGEFGSVLSSWPRTFSVNDGADYEIHPTLRAALDAYHAARQAGEVADA